MKNLKTPMIALFLMTLAANSLVADEISDNILDALSAYEEGEIQETKEILQYVSTLLEAQSANVLESFLPPAPDGWTRILESDAEEAAMMALLGGSGSVQAAYSSDAGDTARIVMMVDSPMNAMMAMQFSNPAMMAQMGTVKRVNRQQILLKDDGMLEALVSGRFLIQIEGSASDDMKIELFKGIDIRGLKSF